MEQYASAPDEALVQRAINGDGDAYGQLIERHTGLVYALAYAETLSTEDAEDVAQDTFTRAHARLGQLRAPARFTSWLARIAVSCARNRRRGNQYEGRARQDYRDVPTAAQPITDRIERRDLVERGLGAIPESYRHAIIMRYMRDSSYPDIAKALLITESAAEIRVRRGLSMLRQFFRRAGLDEDCRDALRTHCLSVQAVVPLATLLRARMSGAGRPAGDVSRPAPTLTASVIAVGAVFSALLIGTAVIRGPDDPPGTYAPDGSMTVESVARLLHRPVVGLSSPLPTKLGTEVISPSDQLEGWLPALPGKDRALPDAANGALPGRPGAGIIANDYGVYRPFDPVTGVITIQTWLMPAEAESDVALGLVFGPSQHEWERILRRAEGGDWLYRSGYGEGPLPNTRSKSVTVTITYRTADGTYDMSLDGYPVITNASLVSEFAGRPVEGVFLRSGSSFQGRRTYFDELSVIHRPEDRRGRLASVHVPPRAQPRETTPRIRILSASLNGQTTDLASPTFFVQEGAPIRGRVSFQIDNPHPDQASFPVVCVPTWGRHSSSYITATPDAPTGVSEMAVNLLLPAPPGPGTYHVIIAGVAETDPAHVALGTNWAGGDAVWNNDTDIASWGPELLDAAARDGAVTPPWLDSRSRRWRTEAGAAVIRVVVGESPSVVASKLGR